MTHKALPIAIFLCSLSLLGAFIISSDDEIYLPNLDEENYAKLLSMENLQAAPGKFRVQLINYHNMFYLANITIGSEQERFQLLIDINSPVTWVTSPTFKDVRAIRNHFDCEKSHTCKELDKAYNYILDGFVISGQVIQDQIRLHHDYALKNQTILLVDHIQRRQVLQEAYPPLSDLFNRFSIDGVLGLGTNTSTTKFISIVDNIQRQSLINEVAYAIFLSYNHEGNVDNYSQLVIGQHDPEYLKTHNYSIFPLLKRHQGWAVALNNVHVGKTKVANRSSAIFAVNSPFIQAPTVVWEELIKTLNEVDKSCRFDPKAHFLHCNCEGTSEIEKFPSMIFELPDKNKEIHKLRVTPERYVQFIRGKCFLALSKNEETDNWVLGDAFLREYYSYYARHEGFVALASVRLHNEW